MFFPVMSQPPSPKRHKASPHSDTQQTAQRDTADLTDAEDAPHDSAAALLSLPSSSTSHHPARHFHHISIFVLCSVASSGSVSLQLEVARLTKAERRQAARQRKYDFLVSIRKDRRKEYKQRQKERKQLARSSPALPSDSSLPPPPSPPLAAAAPFSTLKGKRLRESVMRRSACAPTVCIDMAYESAMQETEVHSLSKQLRFLYADNLRAARPLRIVISSFGPAEAETGDEEAVADSDAPSPSGSVAIFSRRLHEDLNRISGFPAWALTCLPQHFSHYFPSPPHAPLRSSFAAGVASSSVVYLTAESPCILYGLRADTLYVIGGLVDHNHLRGHCEREAQRLQLRTARLPIADIMRTEGGVGRRTVITVNQVFRCLLECWQQQQRDGEAGEGKEEEQQQQQEEAAHGWEARWAEVFSKTLPARAGWVVKGKVRGQSDEEEKQQQPELSMDTDDVAEDADDADNAVELSV